MVAGAVAGYPPWWVGLRAEPAIRPESPLTPHKSGISYGLIASFKVLRMDPSVQRVLAAFRSGIERLYAEWLRRIILYGSWARGEGTEDSDIDVAVVLGGEVTPGREIDRMIDLVTQVNLDFGVLLSVLMYTSSMQHVTVTKRWTMSCSTRTGLTELTCAVLTWWLPATTWMHPVKNGPATFPPSSPSTLPHLPVLKSSSTVAVPWLNSRPGALIWK